jgi:hypothetical protein
LEPVSREKVAGGEGTPQRTGKWWRWRRQRSEELKGNRSERKDPSDEQTIFCEGSGEYRGDRRAIELGVGMAMGTGMGK